MEQLHLHYSQTRLEDVPTDGQRVKLKGANAKVADDSEKHNEDLKKAIADAEKPKPVAPKHVAPVKHVAPAKSHK